ncbi:MAG: hypothetical protein M3357_11320 [Actinomycetota bacterium]|nr:hypothetical protein [Actinomycetota bacterium]
MNGYPDHMAPAAPRRKHRGGGQSDQGDVEVRHVQPYEALKTYRCPGCDHEIQAGTGHEVVVPLESPDLRRHWHTGCWWRVSRP